MPPDEELRAILRELADQLRDWFNAQPAPRGGAPAPGLPPYDAAILVALTARPQSAQRLARAAGHRFNSYFRERLAALVEAGHARRTRRGYSRA